MEHQNVMTPEQPGTDSAPQALEDKVAAMFGGGEEETPDEPEQHASPESDEQPTEQPEGTQDDSEDVDFEGLQLKLPKEAASKLKSAVEGYKDYTKKTQEVAEQRRAVEAQSQLLREQQAFQASITQELSQFHQIESQLEQYRKLDWTQIPMEQAFQYRAMVDQLKDQKEQLSTQLKTKQQDFQQKLAQHKRQLAEAQSKAVKLAIPKWDEKAQKSTSEYLLNKGYTPEQLGSNYDPVFVELAFKASQWDALQASKPSVTQRANSAPPVIRPGAGSTQPSKAVQAMNYAKALKNAPDSAAKAKIIAQRMEQKFR
jgi:hypothetical protein